MDGTLLDSMALWSNLGTMYFEYKDLEPDPSINAVLYNYSTKQISRELIRLYPQLTQEEILKDFHHLIQKFYRETATPKPYIREYLQKLRQEGIPMCVATVTERRYVEEVLSRHGLLEFFEFIETVPEFGALKSDPRFFLSCAQRLNAAPGDCMVFEDALYAVTTAAEAGFQITAIRDFSSEDDWEEIKALADRSIESYSELL